MNYGFNLLTAPETLQTSFQVEGVDMRNHVAIIWLLVLWPVTEV